jgi:DNA-binding response OmpR family regulator
MRIEIKNGKKTLSLGSLTLEALREYKNKVVKRKEIIKEIWKICDEIGEEEIEKMINDLKNKIKGEKNEHK